MNRKTTQTISAGELTLTAMFVALIALGAWISVPVGVTSITLQTLFVMLAGLILPRKYALAAVGAYLLLGLIGLPVFAGGTGGLAILAKPSLGFLLGFFPLAYAASIHSSNPKKIKIVNLVIGNVVLYIIGFAYMYLYFNQFMAKPMSAAAILQVGILPYLPGDALKIGLATVLAQVLAKMKPIHS